MCTGGVAESRAGREVVGFPQKVVFATGFLFRVGSCVDGRRGRHFLKV